MKQLTLTIREINSLNSIKEMLLSKQSLSSEQQAYLANFLSQLPSEENLLSNKIPLDMPLAINVWDAERLEARLRQWAALFKNIPSYGGSTFCIVTNENEEALIAMGTVIVTMFSPTLSYAMNLERIAPDHGGFEVHLKDDGTAWFRLRTLEDAEEYPGLYNFKGSWKEAYLLLIETLKKGWPMEEFPEELLPLLKK